jgi:hypothetical protein
MANFQTSVLRPSAATSILSGVSAVIVGGLRAQPIFVAAGVELPRATPRSHGGEFVDMRPRQLRFVDSFPDPHHSPVGAAIDPDEIPKGLAVSVFAREAGGLQVILPRFARVLVRLRQNPVVLANDKFVANAHGLLRM